jgi:glycine betaine/choline ABC-type transport system substrate-binding protein
MSEIIFIPAIYEGSRDLKDKTKKLIFNTNETTPNQAAELQLCVQNYVFLAIKREEFTKDQVELISNLKTDYEDTGKTPSQRLRAVLYRLWEQNNEGYKDFNRFYDFKMEGFITHLKGKLT